uniref:interferon alpha/beta receptor 2-like isoform X2 n=1 Tax=Semicossyphus pulcher TaxID=241346 RepID=UPI0037E78084
MAALLWMLTSLFQVLPAMTELPPPINLTLTSDHLIHLLRWQQGAATPTGTSYSVSVCPETGTSWLPVPGCQTVQDPLVCNLTEAFSDPHQAYFTQVTAQLEGQTSQSVIHQGFKPIKDTILNPPLLHVTPCGRNLCVDLQPPLPHLRHIYTHLKYTLKITSSEDRVQFSEDSVSLGRRVLERLGPSRRYCVSVCLTDSLELRQSDYSRPVCAFTPSTFSADAVISALLCVLLMFFVFTVALLVYAGFICLKRRPLPSVLTSLHHIEEVLILAPPCNSSLSPLFNVKPTAPSSGDRGSHTCPSTEHSEEESDTESSGGEGDYKQRAAANLLSSSSSSSSVSAPSSPPSSSSHFPSDSFTSGAPCSVETAPSANRTPPLQTLTDTHSPPAGGGKEGRVSLNVNLLTLTFGRHQEEEEQEPESSSNITPFLPKQKVNVETVSCPDDDDDDDDDDEEEEEAEEEEEEESSGYMGR